MVFSSLTFLLLFFPLVMLFYFMGSGLKWRNGVLLVFSLLFYAWGEPIWVLAMITSTVINYYCALQIARSEYKYRKKKFLIIGVVVSVAMLFYFKYASFLLSSVTGIFGKAIEIPGLELPIGISFYTFQILTYTVDVYRGKSPCMKNLPRLMLYISCFPQLIAGPIVQYSDVCDALNERSTNTEDFICGMRRFAVGLGKKVLIANVSALALDQLSLGSGSISVLGAWYGAILYSLQIYFDFAGYSDMAIGMGRIFGFKYKENFSYPYISKSISEFWRRWHISLGSFFRDYVYIPLGGNRRGTKRTIINLLIVWSLTGFWHGADWNFLMWGAYYGVLIILERFVFSKIIEKMPNALNIFLTLILVIVGWVIFYYTDLGDMKTHILAMFGMQASGGGIVKAAFSDAITMAVMRRYTVLPVLFALACTPVVPAVKERLEKRNAFAFNAVSGVCYVSVMALSLLFIIGQSYNPFIYFRF